MTYPFVLDEKVGFKYLEFAGESLVKEGFFYVNPLGDWVAHGPVVSLGAQGRPMVQSNYKDGSLDGLVTMWSESGRVEFTGQFAKGQEEGRSTYYLPDGSVDAARSGVYRAGVLQRP